MNMGEFSWNWTLHLLLGFSQALIESHDFLKTLSKKNLSIRIFELHFSTICSMIGSRMNEYEKHTSEEKISMTKLYCTIKSMK